MKHIQVLVLLIISNTVIAAGDSGYGSYDNNACIYWAPITVMSGPYQTEGGQEDYPEEKELRVNLGLNEHWVLVVGSGSNPKVKDTIFEFSALCNFRTEAEQSILECRSIQESPVKNRIYKKTSKKNKLAMYQCISGCNESGIITLYNSGWEPSPEDYNDKEQIDQKSFQAKCGWWPS